MKGLLKVLIVGLFCVVSYVIINEGVAISNLPGTIDIVNDNDTVTEMTTTGMTSTSTLDVIDGTTETTVTTMEEDNEQQPVLSSFKKSLHYVGAFQGTYFNGATVPCNGGSGRELMDCSPKVQSIKGSIASKQILKEFGYNFGDLDRTLVYIEFYELPDMAGWYMLDDCNADSSIVDFYFADVSTCPWQNNGVIPVNVWIDLEH